MNHAILRLALLSVLSEEPDCLPALVQLRKLRWPHRIYGIHAKQPAQDKSQRSYRNE